MYTWSIVYYIHVCTIYFIYLILFIRVKHTVKKLKIHTLHIYINQYKDN